MPERAVDRLASDEDRERAVQLLRGAAGQLGLGELEQRLDAAVQARTLSQLAPLVWDVQARPPAKPPKVVPIWWNGGFRLHATSYALVNGFLVGTWAVTGAGFFWPFFPLAGWGIWLGLHATSLHASQVRRRQRAARRLARRDQLTARAGSARTPRGRWVGREPELSPARDRVVVMFTDIVESTRLTEVLGDDDWSRLRSRHLTLLRELYDGHRGKEVSTQGDGCMAQFDSPSDAVGCAVEIQRRLQAQRSEAGFALSVRIGLHAGDAVVEPDDLLGSVVNTAARVMSEAAPGEILVTETLADQLDSRVELEDRGLRTLRGLARPRHLLAVAWDT